MPCDHHRFLALLVAGFTLLPQLGKGAIDGYETKFGALQSNDGALQNSDTDPSPYIQAIIHTTSAVAALADGGLAQLPGLGAAVVPTIQAGMVAIIGRHHGCHLDASNALAIVTFFASNHAKKALIKEVVGFVPMFGNLAKTAITGFMTEGIGNLADSMLRCPTSTDQILDNLTPASTADVGLFHAMSDYLSTGDQGSSASVGEMWERISHQYFSSHSEAQLLEEVASASGADFVTILRKNRWNLNAVSVILDTLKTRFPHDRDKCIVVDVVGNQWWSSPGLVEAKLITALYLSECLALASSSTRRVIAKTSTRLLTDTRGGSRGGVAPEMTGYVLDLVSLTAEEPAETPLDEVWDSTLEPSPIEDSQATMVPVLSLNEILSGYGAAMKALRSGHEAACDAMRTLLRAEGAALRTSSGMRRGSSVASVRDLEYLGNIEIPGRAAICLPYLRQDIQHILTMGGFTSQVERANDVKLSEPIVSSGRGQLDDTLNSAIVGQPCAVKRLTRTPGYARLRMGGFWGQDKPLVLLLTGPSGTGKTLMARTLAEILLGKPIAELESTQRFRTFHMNAFTLVEDQKSFFGPPKGIVGTGDLPEILKAWPDAVILLDEVEKAHPSFSRALLKVLGENGAVYDPHSGRDIPSGRATFLLTSNLAKDLILERGITSKHIDAKDPDCSSYEALREEVMQVLRSPRVHGQDNFFKESEVRGRLTDVLPFLPFDGSDIENAVRRFLKSESDVFQNSPQFLHASLSWEPEVVAFLSSDYAQRPEEGLRSVHTQVQTQVREIVQLAIESGLVKKFCDVTLWVRRGMPSSLDVRVSTATSKLEPEHKADYVSSFTSNIFHTRPWWTLGIGDSSSVPSGSSGSSGAWLEGPNVLWQWEADWNWELFWQQMLDWVFDNWHYCAASAVALVGVALAAPWAAAAFAPATAAAFAPATGVALSTPIFVASAPVAVATASGMTAAFSSGLLSLILPVGVTAATFYAGSYAWENRFWILATATACGLIALFLPVLLKTLSNICWRRCVAYFEAPHPKKRKVSRGAIRKFSIWHRRATTFLRRRSSCRTAESRNASTVVKSGDSRRDTSDQDLDVHVFETDTSIDPPVKIRRRICHSQDAHGVSQPRPFQRESLWNPVFSPSAKTEEVVFFSPPVKSEEAVSDSDDSSNSKKRKLDPNASSDTDALVENPNPPVVGGGACVCKAVLQEGDNFCTNCGRRRSSEE